MRLLNLVPVISDVWTPEMGAYTFQYLRDTTEVVTLKLEHGPSSIEGEYDEMLAAPEVAFYCEEAERGTWAAGKFDGVFVNCFGDPGVRAAREAVRIPVFGGFEPAMHMALGVADNLSIISVLKNVLPLIHGSISKAGLGKRVVSLREIGVPVLDLIDHQLVVQKLIEQSVQAITVDNAHAIVLGCTGFVNVREEVQAGLLEAGYDTVVIEAAQAAMVMLENFVTVGYMQSRLNYMPPRQKDRNWWTS